MVLICGDRNWTDKDIIRAWLSKLQDWGYNTVIEGEARGADSIARNIAKELGFNVEAFPAQWELFGKAAGMMRNSQMLSFLIRTEKDKPLVVAFHNDIERSKGTADMVKQASRQDIEVIIVGEVL